MSARAGVVYLVGAGPGDPGLMTARSLELIGSADAVFYYRLIPPGALAGARGDAELVYVGKQPGVPSVPQEEIGRVTSAIPSPRTRPMSTPTSRELPLRRPPPRRRSAPL